MQPLEQLPESTVAARKRVQVGPLPPWVIPVAFHSDLPAQPEDHCTQLLLCRQMNVESQAAYTHTAVRLETMQAVQQISQWRLQFQPDTETIIVHWVRIRRGDEVIDYTQPERFRILQREEGLESFVVDGSFTLLLLLEDVRVGDILETCCTRESQRKLMPNVASAFFTLPAEGAVGKYYFSLRCNESRPVKWKSSHDNLTPVENRENGEVLWMWEGERYVAPKTEWNTPEWYSESRWIQFSDISDWQSVSAAVHKAWPNEDDDPVIDQLLQDVVKSCPDLQKKVEKIIRFVQDDYRYLSINWESGGSIPATPSRVARRRFGDCKDLAFLSVHLLNRLGVSARPVLVNTALRGAIKTMLPTPDLFNHAIVEFTLDGQRRWVDAVAKLQGGNALEHVIPNFGAGLAIDAVNGSLVEPPSIQPSVYEVKETLLLDTTGAPSLLSVIITAKGLHAEKLRHQFANIRREDIEKERLQNCANRFVTAQRVGTMEIRDDRDANQFCIAERFEVNGFLQACTNPALCICPLPPNSVFSILCMPDQKMRHSPFALPYPCHLIHTIELECSALQPIPYKRCNLQNQFLRFSRAHKNLYQNWSVTFEFSTLVDSVPAEKVEAHRQMLLELKQESCLQIYVPIGHSRSRPRGSFGKLPGLPVRSQIASTERNQAPKGTPEVVPTRVAPTENPVPRYTQAVFREIQPPPKKRSKRHHKKKSTRIDTLFKMAVAIGVCIAAALIFLVTRQ